MSRGIWRGQPTIRMRLLRMAAQPDGVSNTEAQSALGITSAHFTADCKAMHAMHLVRRVDVQGQRLRFFITEDGRQALQSMINSVNAQGKKLERVPKPRKASGPALVPIGQDIRSLANRPGPMAVSIKAGLTAKTAAAAIARNAVVPPKPSVPAPVWIAPAKPLYRPADLPPAAVVPVRGIAAGFDARYQCAPGEQPYGAGFAAVGLGRDVQTGRGW